MLARDGVFAPDIFFTRDVVLAPDVLLARDVVSGRVLLVREVVPARVFGREPARASPARERPDSPEERFDSVERPRTFGAVARRAVALLPTPSLPALSFFDSAVCPT